MLPPPALSLSSLRSAELSPGRAARSRTERTPICVSVCGPPGQGECKNPGRQRSPQRPQMMTTQDVTVKKEQAEEEIPGVIWQNTKESNKGKMNEGGEEIPAEICVVIGDNRNQQNIGEDSPERHSATMSREPSWTSSSRARSIPPRISTSSPGAYECGICRKKYKYYNCFQTHVRAHIGKSPVFLTNNETGSGEGASQGNNFRYTCDICGKKYKYYSCFQEHRDLHAVDDTYIHMMVTSGDAKEEDPEPFLKLGPKTGNYTCEFCGKQYKYYTPYQEHVALHAPLKGTFSHDIEHKVPNNYEETNSNSQHSSGSSRTHGMSDMVVAGNITAWQKEPANQIIPSSFPLLQKPYTCGACGIQFQFYTNLLEHMQSHAADNENNVSSNQARSLPPVEENWKPQVQRNSINNSTHSSTTGPLNNSLPEKERQHIAERLLRVMCADLGALSVVNGKEFLKLAQTLVDTGARYGSFSVHEILGNMNTLAVKHLPRMYNQVKVKVTCALGSNICLGIGVTCHAQCIGTDSCYILTAYQAECNQIKRYVLGIKDVDNRDSGEFIHQWVQNVLSEFVMSEIRTVYVTDCKVNSSAFSKSGGTCLRCSACSLNSVVQSVLSKRTLQARNMHEVIELLNVSEELAGSSGISKETFGSLEETSPPPCWNSVTDSLLLVHERYEQICEFYSRAKKPNVIQNLNKHLLSNLAAILGPVKQAVIELSNERKPTLQLVLPTYVKLEKLFTSKANDAGVISKLCHLFLEALKENFKVESAHKVAMILDPQQKLRPVPPYQHEEIIGKVCELINEVRDGSEEGEFEAPTKKPRPAAETTKVQDDDRMGKNEVYDYLQEPLFQVTPDLFQYWSSVAQKHVKLSKLAFWLLAVPAVGARSECVNMCEQTLLIKRRRLLSPEDMNKVMFLRSNML
ncbi:zinc finger protein 618-like isoform X5 [Pelobates fuscus]|uniref:zinc finger protein 618-like isoform X5 n=1 Tax=Pelobates fuscus TaxID=191477 RepID=UPI002FE4DC36